MTMRNLRLCALGAAAFMALLSTGADAFCSCACVNGKVQNACSNQFDTEVYCSKYCPPNVLPPWSPQKNPDLGEVAATTDRSGPQDKLYVGGGSQ